MKPPAIASQSEAALVQRMAERALEDSKALEALLECGVEPQEARVLFRDDPAPVEPWDEFVASARRVN